MLYNTSNLLAVKSEIYLFIFVLVTTDLFYSQYVIVFRVAFHILMPIKECYWSTEYFQFSTDLGLTKLEACVFTGVAVSLP
jgi:hypothetical protein